MEDQFLTISANFRIPISEIEVSFSRSGGPGGQHVNKTSTQAELVFDLQNSPSVSEYDRSWLVSRLSSKLDSAGRLHISSQAFRSQLRNKQAALEKLEELLRAALVRPKPRRKTKPSKTAKETRLKSKKRNSEKKQLRSKTPDRD